MSHLVGLDVVIDMGFYSLQDLAKLLKSTLNTVFFLVKLPDEAILQFHHDGLKA